MVHVERPAYTLYCNVTTTNYRLHYVHIISWSTECSGFSHRIELTYINSVIHNYNTELNILSPGEAFKVDLTVIT